MTGKNKGRGKGVLRALLGIDEEQQDGAKTPTPLRPLEPTAAAQPGREAPKEYGEQPIAQYLKWEIENEDGWKRVHLLVDPNGKLHDTRFSGMTLEQATSVITQYAFLSVASYIETAMQTIGGLRGDNAMLREQIRSMESLDVEEG